MKKIPIYILIFSLILEIFSISATATTDTAKSTVVMDIETGRVLYEQNPHTKRLIASITKIMTAIIVLENTDLNKEVEIGPEILTMYGTNIYIEVGEKMKVKDLLYGLILRSGNDAAVSLAVATAGSEENFVRLMNQKAQEIGMNNTTFANPHGLDEETKNYSTAYDMALLSQYAYNNKTYREIIGTKKYTCTTTNKTYLWYNRTKLLTEYKNCLGGKNGYTPDAGKTLVSVAKKDNLTLTTVTLKDPDIYGNHKRLYETYFGKYSQITIINKNTFNKNKSNKKANIYIKRSFSYPLTAKEKKQITTKINLNNESSSSNVYGTIDIYLGNEKIGQVSIYKKIEKKKDSKKSFFTKIKNLFTR